MSIIGRWNWRTHEYEPYITPPEWKIRLFSEDMDELVNCARCGIDLKYGDTLTSRELHNGLGLGYPVCDSCHEAEYAREREAKAEELQEGSNA